MKNIALIDPYWSGHHSSYLNLITKTLLSLGHNVMVFCPNPLELRNWIGVNCKQHQEKLLLVEMREPKEFCFPVLRVQMALNGLTWWRFAAKVVKKAQSETGFFTDLVFFPWLDSYLGRYQSHRIIDKIFPYNWSGIYFHPFHLRLSLRSSTVRGGPHDYDESLHSNRCRSVAILDEGVKEKLQEKLPDKPVIIFPDIADATQPDHNFSVLHEVIAKSDGRKIITLIGGLAKRKGILTLLETARKSPSAEWFFLFAGHLSEDSFGSNELQFIREIESNPPQNCYFHFNFIPEEAQFNSLVEVSDILFASYENFPHSSNILTKAAIFEKPLIVSRGFCMEERIKAFKMGESIEYDNVSQCIDAIGRLLETKELRADFAGYRLIHSEERLRLAFQAICNNYFM